MEEGGAIVATVSPADQTRAQSLLQHALRMSGMSPESVAAMTQAALAVGAVDSGSSLASATVVASQQYAEPVSHPSGPSTGPTGGGREPAPLTLVGSSPPAAGERPARSADDHLAQARDLDPAWERWQVDGAARRAAQVVHDVVAGAAA